MFAFSSDSGTVKNKTKQKTQLFVYGPEQCSLVLEEFNFILKLQFSITSSYSLLLHFSKLLFIVIFSHTLQGRWFPPTEMKGKEKCGDVELNSVFPPLFFFFNFNYSPLLQKLTCDIQVIREFYKTIVCLTGKQLQSTWRVEKHYKGEEMHV